MPDISSPNVPAEPLSPGDRLDSWKEIAGYLRRSARTVQRWERSEGLPIHRLGHEKLGSVYAYRTELDAWWEERRLRLEPQQEEPAAEAADHGDTPPWAGEAHVDDRRAGVNRGLLGAAIAAGLLVAASLGYAVLVRSGAAGGAPVAGRAIRLAVLPFANLTGSADREFLSDGVTEEMIAELGRLPELGVIARTSVMRYKNTESSARDIGRALNVDYVLEGSVRETGNRVRVTTQLIRAEDETHVWAETYDRELSDLLAIQGQVARQVALQIRLHVPSVAEPPGVDAEAHLDYLRGRFHWNMRTADGFRQGIAYFLRAIDRDPDYARAYSGLADSYLLMGNYGYMPPAEAMPKAQEAAERALALDDTLAEGHASLGNVLYVFRWDFAGAEREFERAIALNPNYAPAHLWFGIMLQNLGRFEEGQVEFLAGLEADPLSGVLRGNLAYLNYYTRKFDAAIADFEAVHEKEPESVGGIIDLARAYVAGGRAPEALRLMEVAHRIEPDIPMVDAVHGYVLARAGRHDEARAMAQRLEASPAVVSSHPDYIALVYAGLGDKDRAVAWLRRVVDGHGIGALSLAVYPEYDVIRDDPRFQALVAEVGLTRD